VKRNNILKKKEIIFYSAGGIKLIRSGCKGIQNVTKDFKWIINLLFIK